MLYPRLNDLNMVQEPSSCLFCHLLSPFCSTRPSSFSWKHWTRSTGYLCQLPLPLFLCASSWHLDPVLLMLVTSCSKGPRTDQEKGVWYKISPTSLCSELAGWPWPWAGCINGCTAVRFSCSPDCMTLTDLLNAKLPKVVCLSVCSCIINAV